MVDQVATRAAFAKTMREAKVALLQSLVRIPFLEPGHGGFVTIVGVTPDGPSVDSADDPGNGRIVPWDRVDGLVKAVAASGLGHRNSDGWERKTGGGFVYDWPHLVTMSGWSYEDLQMRGISWCLNNRRRGGEESWVV